VFSEITPWRRVGDQGSTWVLLRLAEVRTPWLTDVANGINAAGTGWGITVLGLSVVVLIIIFRRWRHLAVFLGSLVFVEIVAGQLIYNGLTRPRPYGVLIIGSWGGYSAPSIPVAAITIFLAGALYSLVVPGRPRTCGKTAAAVVIAVFGLARLYLAVDHPDDVLLGVALGVAVPVAAFRYFTPNEVFPVAYRRGRTAHVDVGGRRGDAIRVAVHDQLGLTVLEIKPVGLASSAGSTPLRLQVEGGPEEYLFAKLYTKGHVRADRWYKLWRMIRYGSLEDEHPFQTVRRFVEYEDYTLRLLRDAGIRTAKPYGIVEITPEREYMTVTEFFSGAAELGDADIDDDVIDQGLLLVRELWDAGIAHRDIKPGNLMVRRGELLLIDVMFVQVRPSPWRQAVDLGNMMLVLAVRTDAERVYRRALNYFTQADLAEAFAATRGVASPTQLRASMKKDRRDLLGTFRALAPPREPIPLQRWSFRRVGLALGILVATGIAVAVSLDLFKPTGDLGALAPTCGTGHSIILAAQAVPSAALVPCVGSLPAGWSVHDGADIVSGHATFWLDSDVAGTQALAVTLSATCDISGAQQVPSDQPGTRRFDRPLSQQPQFAELRSYTFPGAASATSSTSRMGVGAAGDSGERRGALHAPGCSGEPRQEHRGPGAARTGRGMSRLSRLTAARRPEEAILAAPVRDVAVTATVLVLTAVAFAAAADHGILAHIRRVDDAWLRLMVSGRSAPVTVIAKFFNLLGLVYVTLPVRIAIAGYLALRRRWWHMAAFVAAVVLSEVLIGTLKNVYDRIRPPGSLVATSGASFPSGHAIAASVTVIAAVIALVPPGRRRVAWGAAALGFSILMAASRAYLAAHWLSDAVAGILLGTSCALLAAVVVDGLQRRWQARGTSGAPGPAGAHVAEEAGRADRP
jgi:membrane-associated phospholipid phosphatase/tRNA A-37 threonylcarbamoyl transferase component Bud32